MTRRKFVLAAGSGLLGTAAAAAAGGVAFVATREARRADQFRARAVFDGEPMAGMTFGEAVARAESRWAPYVVSPIVVRLGARTWAPTAAEVGIEVDYMTPLQDAYAWGRDERDEAYRTTSVAGGPGSLVWHTRVSFNQAVFSAYMQRILESVMTEPVDSVLRIESHTGRTRLVIDPSRWGDRIARAPYVESVVANLRPPARMVVELATETTGPAIDEAMLEPVAAKAEVLLSGHIRLNSPVAEWAIAREALVSAVSLIGPAHDPEIHFTLHYRGFERLARQIADDTRVRPVLPRIRVNSHGEIVTVVNGREGRQVDVEELWARVQSAFPVGDSVVDVPIVTVQPDMSRLSDAELQFDNVIAVGESFFRGSGENRVRNIDNGSSFIDGTVVAPGESISVNKIVGPITTDNGFVEGLVIAPTRTEPGVGGGICQVSTTLFRALFWAGLPIVERWQHVYRVRYYELGGEDAEGHPPGFDAAIWQPSQDLRAINDTPNYLLIRREFDPTSQALRFNILGAPVGRRVTLESWQGDPIEPPPMRIEPNPELEPGETKQTDTPKEGMQAVIYRYVSIGQQEVSREQFVSEFVAWPERWEVGPREDGSIDTSKVAGYVPTESEAASEDEGATSEVEPADSG